ncbi:hypothetical protein N7490_001826 [Penicillium lividum]|nr:hypothetical protein N7490_001826 [Penicillium lividum]
MAEKWINNLLAVGPGRRKSAIRVEAVFAIDCKRSTPSRAFSSTQAPGTKVNAIAKLAGGAEPPSAMPDKVTLTTDADN